MSKQVPWNKTILEKFIEEAMLNDTEIYIMTSRIKGATVTQQAMHLNISEASVHRIIADLKKRYDVVQKNNPDFLPPRRSSAKERYLDTH